MIDIVVQKSGEFIPKTITRDQAKDTGMAAALICLLIGWLGSRPGFFQFAIVVLLLTMIWPRALQPAAKLWFGLSHLIGTMMSKILLSVLFFLLVAPMGIIRRLAGHDSLQLRKWKKDRSSVFKIREHNFTENDIKYPY